MPIYIPGPKDNAQMCGADFGIIQAEYKALSLDTIKSIDDLGTDEALSLLQAVQQFKIDHLPQYGTSEITSDTNTYAGGLVGTQATRSMGVIYHMKYIEKLLKEYQLASGVERAKLKASIRSAYKSLNSEFGTVLNNYAARTGKKVVLLSSRQGMKAALKGRTNITNSAKARPLINAARGFRHISRWAQIQSGIYFDFIYIRGWIHYSSTNSVFANLPRFCSLSWNW